MVDTDQLREMRDALWVYDVVQEGWEHEDKGLDINMRHVGLHLSDVIDRKDFMNEGVIANEIAPDSLQYALRLSRWGNLAIAAIAPDDDIRREVEERGCTIGTSLDDFISITRANAVIARNRHDVDHASTKEKGLNGERSAMQYAAKLLVHSANLQADFFEFDIMESFTMRLASLRERFNIPPAPEIPDINLNHNTT